MRALTWDANSSRIQQLAKFHNVAVVEGRQNDYKYLHKAFHDVYGT